MTAFSIFELRRYRLVPHGFDALRALFEREFIETQEACGMRVEGIYRDLRDPQAFVWIRSFPDMEARTRALAAFYTGKTWERWGADANATMVNSDNVLLLRPAGSAPPFRHSPANPPATVRMGDDGSTGHVAIGVASLAPGSEAAFAEDFAAHAVPLIEASGARLDASFVTESQPNGFPRLPVHQGETVFAWVATYPDAASHAVSEAALERMPGWRDRVMPLLDRQMWRPLDVTRLRPTGRSRHRW